MVRHTALIASSLLSGVIAGCPFQKSLAGMTKVERQSCPHALDALPPVGPDTTKQGCTCQHPCGASIEEDTFNCDWCYTTDNCGTKGLGGTWDFCAYKANATYEGESWKTKYYDLWGAVQADQKSGTYPTVLGIVSESVQTSFQNHRDTMPEERVKYIHSVGAVCKFGMKVAANSPFTGLFAAGQQVNGLIRMGSALPVTLTSGVVPGVGVKFLRNGVESGNFVALNTLNALPNSSYNFFELPLSNHIPAPNSAATKIVATKFTQASGCPTQVGLSDICRWDVDGKEAASIKFPFKVTMTARQQLPSTPVSQEELQKMLLIPTETPLYDIAAYTDKTNSIPLGTMITDGDCVNSAFGDASLFFRHQLIEEDWALNPTFMSYVDASADCGASKISATPPRQCDAP